jgi:hypothetical protein
MDQTYGKVETFDQKPIEPPPEHTIVFKSGGDVTYRISRKTIDQIANDFGRGMPCGAYDVETKSGEYRKLMFHFEDVLYIG